MHAQLATKDGGGQRLVLVDDDGTEIDLSLITAAEGFKVEVVESPHSYSGEIRMTLSLWLDGIDFDVDTIEPAITALGVSAEDLDLMAAQLQALAEARK